MKKSNNSGKKKVTFSFQTEQGKDGLYRRDFQ